MSPLHARTEGYYEAYPEVNWDLAQERWLGAPRGMGPRSDTLLAAVCLSCSWRSEPEEYVLAKPERLRIAEFIIESQHWYQCPGVPRVKFIWLSDLWTCPSGPVN